MKTYIGTLFASMLFIACGDSSSTDPDEVLSSGSANGNKTSAEADYSAESYDLLPACDDEKEGQTGYVTKTSELYVCKDGEWEVSQESDSPNSSASEDKSDPVEPSSESSEANSDGYDPSTKILTDSRDGQKYRTTTIGDQIWMAENLNYAYLLPTRSLDSSSFCYNNDPENCKTYGRLYLWSAALDSAGVLENDGKGKDCGSNDSYCSQVEGDVQGVCPKGWHLPSAQDFRELLASVGEKSGNKLCSESVWKDEEKGSDMYGFSAIPAGYRGYNSFYLLGGNSYLWSSTPYGRSDADYLIIFGGYNEAGLGNERRDFGMSVRCLKD